MWDGTRPWLVGIVNVTPDSFSDGGLYAAVDAAVAHGEALCAVGADLIDIGGESTRPGAVEVSADEEVARVVPVIAQLATRVSRPISVDTTKAEVACAAIDAGATCVNDISGGRFDAAMWDVCAEREVAYVGGHAPGSDLAEVHAHAASPQMLTIEAITAELSAALAAMPTALRARTIVDPGLGFGKGTALNLALCAAAGGIGRALGCPVMVGPSRKRFLGELTGLPAPARDGATAGIAIAAVRAGADFIRVHDVGLTRAALTTFEACTQLAPGAEAAAR